jgi:uncharacterized protein (TIGR00251 family)
MNWPCVQLLPDDRCALLVAVIPNARRTEAVGLHDGCLRVRLQAPALEGRANDALVAWVASALDLPRRDVVLQQGAASRRKRLLIEQSADRVEAWLDQLGIEAG